MEKSETTNAQMTVSEQMGNVKENAHNRSNTD